MRLIDADEAKKLERMVTLKPSERALFKLMLDRMPTYEPSNPPLTLEQLREMDGEPVWIEYIPSPGEETAGFWALVSADKEDGEVFLLNSLGGSSSYEEAWADIRAIYRRKPEEKSR